MIHENVVPESGGLTFVQDLKAGSYELEMGESRPNKRDRPYYVVTINGESVYFSVGYAYNR